MMYRMTVIVVLAVLGLGAATLRGDSLNCRLIGSCGTPAYALGVAVSGNYAYVADDTSGLRTIDISNPQSPVEVGFCDTVWQAYGMAVSGNYAYEADGSGGLRIIDVSNPRGRVSGTLPLTPGLVRTTTTF